MAKIIEIPIKGMTCTGCAQAVSRALRKVEGVINASFFCHSKPSLPFCHSEPPFCHSEPPFCHSEPPFCHSEPKAKNPLKRPFGFASG